MKTESEIRKLVQEFLSNPRIANNIIVQVDPHEQYYKQRIQEGLVVNSSNFKYRLQVHFGCEPVYSEENEREVIAFLEQFLDCYQDYFNFERIFAIEAAALLKTITPSSKLDPDSQEAQDLFQHLLHAEFRESEAITLPSEEGCWIYENLRLISPNAKYLPHKLLPKECSISPEDSTDIKLWEDFYAGVENGLGSVGIVDAYGSICLRSQFVELQGEHHIFSEPFRPREQRYLSQKLKCVSSVFELGINNDSTEQSSGDYRRVSLLLKPNETIASIERDELDCRIFDKKVSYKTKVQDDLLKVMTQEQFRPAFILHKVTAFLSKIESFWAELEAMRPMRPTRASDQAMNAEDAIIERAPIDTMGRVLLATGCDITKLQSFFQEQVEQNDDSEYEDLYVKCKLLSAELEKTRSSQVRYFNDTQLSLFSEYMEGYVIAKLNTILDKSISLRAKTAAITMAKSAIEDYKELFDKKLFGYYFNEQHAEIRKIFTAIFKFAHGEENNDKFVTSVTDPRLASPPARISSDEFQQSLRDEFAIRFCETVNDWIKTNSEASSSVEPNPTRSKVAVV